MPRAGGRGRHLLFPAGYPRPLGEVDKLKSWDVDPTANRVTLEDRKANNLGSVPSTRRAQQIAAKYQHRRGRMFDVPYDTFNRWFNEGKALLGITHPRLTPHCTRHTRATRSAEANVSLALIMQYALVVTQEREALACTSRPMHCWAAEALEG